MSQTSVRSDVPCLIPAERLAERVGQLAEQISVDYAGKVPLVVGVLKGAWVFMADLVRCLTIPVRCDFIMLASYGMATESTGQVTLRLDLAETAENRDILVVEDVVDTGESIRWLMGHLAQKSPASLRLCALLDKPARRRSAMKIDYLGFTVPDRFVVGYGIDCRERYRELPYVGYVRTEDPAQDD